MRLKGSITLEAAYVFAFMAILVFLLIELDFFLNDSLVNDTAKILGGMRSHEAETFYYDKRDEAIDVDAIICSTVIGKDDDFIKMSNSYAKMDVRRYFENNKFDKRSEITNLDIEDVIKVGDNANLIRSGNSVVKLFNSKE